ncbi:MAG TPA: TIGR03620 family F420-dependent LLM class oxidoreductase [Solirubrobacteraceae bacterium]|jgi:probable F420-dependent oxidoreductase|nr:TIGR03620 family F420-dependent LLM class oxidoreductase [Solirubrobacteraceae bacterium]
MSHWKAGLGRVGVWSAELHFGDQEEAADTAAELEALGFGAIWYPGAFGGPVFDMGANLLAATSTVPVAIGILNLWMHDPAEAAAGRARLEEAHPGRFLLGIGVSHRAFVDREDAQRYRQPLSAMKGYLDDLRAADRPVPADGIVLAALKPRMRALAAERTAGIHSYFVPAEHTARTREALGPDALLAPAHAVVLERDAARAREIARRYTAMYLPLPNYSRNLLDLGFSEQDVAGAGSDRLIDALVAWGDPATIAAKVRAHHDAGADHVCVTVLTEGWGGPPFAPPREQYRQLAEMLL